MTLIKDDHHKLESVFKELESAEPAEIKDLLQQVARLLIPHSKAEEQVVYPAIKRIVPSEESDVDDGLAEHQHVEETLTQLLASDPEAPGVDGLIAAMIGEVRHHVEEEEEEILPAFSDAATNQQLSELGREFPRRRSELPPRWSEQARRLFVRRGSPVPGFGVHPDDDRARATREVMETRSHMPAPSQPLDRTRAGDGAEPGPSSRIDPGGLELPQRP